MFMDDALVRYNTIKQTYYNLIYINIIEQNYTLLLIFNHELFTDFIFNNEWNTFCEKYKEPIVKKRIINNNEDTWGWDFSSWRDNSDVVNVGEGWDGNLDNFNVGEGWDDNLDDVDLGEGW